MSNTQISQPKTTHKATKNTESAVFTGKVTTVNLPISEWDNKWLNFNGKNYGMRRAHVLEELSDGSVESTQSDIIQKWNAPLGRFTTVTLKVGPNFAVLPNSFVVDQIKAFHPKLKDSDIQYARDGNAMFVKILSDKRHEVGIGEVVQVGAMFRNSEDASVGFGADAFTMRLACSNGAIARKKELSYYARHVGDEEMLATEIKEAVVKVTERSEQLIAYYKKADAVKMTEELAKMLVEIGIRKKQTPDYLLQDKDSAKVNFDPSRSVWKVFNDYTEKIWHSEKLNIQSKTNDIQRLHEWMFAAVPMVQA